MIGRNFIVNKMLKISLNTTQKFAWKFLTVSEKSSKNWNDFTQLWRQWPCLRKVKIHL